MLKARRSLLQQTQSQGHGSLCGLALESDGSGLRQIENRFESRIEAGAGLEDTSCLDEGEGVLELQLACDGSAGPGQVLCRLIEQRTGSVISCRTMADRKRRNPSARLRVMMKMSDAVCLVAPPKR